MTNEKKKLKMYSSAASIAGKQCNILVVSASKAAALRLIKSKGVRLQSSTFLEYPPSTSRDKILSPDSIEGIYYNKNGMNYPQIFRLL